MPQMPMIGQVTWFAGDFAPANALECQGQPVYSSELNLLYQAVGTAFGGSADGTTFNMPDLSGATIVGAGGAAPAVGDRLGIAAGSGATALAMTATIAAQGVWPTGTAGNGYLGEIIAVAGSMPPPRGTVLCDGSLLSINENEALFVLIGATYGGDGVQTFALPDLRGAIPANSFVDGTLPNGTDVGALALTFVIVTQGFYPSRSS